MIWHSRRPFRPPALFPQQVRGLLQVQMTSSASSLLRCLWIPHDHPWALGCLSLNPSASHLSHQDGDRPPVVPLTRGHQPLACCWRKLVFFFAFGGQALGLSCTTARPVGGRHLLYSLSQSCRAPFAPVLAFPATAAAADDAETPPVSERQPAAFGLLLVAGHLAVVRLLAVPAVDAPGWGHVQARLYLRSCSFCCRGW